MLENLKENECNIIEMFPEKKRDFSAMIPQSILPDSKRSLQVLLI